MYPDTNRIASLCTQSAIRMRTNDICRKALQLSAVPYRSNPSSRRRYCTFLGRAFI